MLISTLKSEIEQTAIFGKMPEFKKRLTIKPNSLQSLLQLHFLAEKHGIGYLQQRTDLNATEVKLIDEIIKKQK